MKINPHALKICLLKMSLQHPYDMKYYEYASDARVVILSWFFRSGVHTVQEMNKKRCTCICHNIRMCIFFIDITKKNTALDYVMYLLGVETCSSLWPRILFLRTNFVLKHTKQKWIFLKQNQKTTFFWRKEKLIVNRVTLLHIYFTKKEVCIFFLCFLCYIFRKLSWDCIYVLKGIH